MNNLADLNNFLFDELRRLNDDNKLMCADNLEKEIQRAKAITDVSNQVVQNAKVMLDAKKHSDTFGFITEKFYSSTIEQNMIGNSAYEEFSKEIPKKNNPTKEQFKDKLFFEIDKQKNMSDDPFNDFGDI